MMFLGLLAIGFLAAWVMPARYGGRSVKTSARHAMGVALVFAGVSHLMMVESFRAHLPEWVPHRDLIVYVTGVIEIVGGLALFARRYQEQVGWAVAAYLVLVFPGNLYVAVAGIDVPGSPDGWYPWVRLPFQALFIWWVLRSTGASIPRLRASGVRWLVKARPALRTTPSQRP
jgi:uncharacterized membrane protein